MNALSDDMGKELQSAFQQCEDPSIRAVVVTGQPHFAAGSLRLRARRRLRAFFGL
jgi:enoyl-CoA hydratase/carnithine racemase